MPESCRSGGDFRALNRRRPPDGCGGQLSLSAINAQRHGLRYRRFGQVVEADCRLFPFNRNARLAPLGAPGPGAGKAMASGRARAVFPRRFSHDPPGYRTPGVGIPPAPGNAPVAAHSGIDPAPVCPRTPAGPGSGWESGPRGTGLRPAAAPHRLLPACRAERPPLDLPPRTGRRGTVTGSVPPDGGTRHRLPGMIPVFRRRAVAPRYADASPLPFSVLRRPSAGIPGSAARCGGGKGIRRKQAASAARRRARSSRVWLPTCGWRRGSSGGGAPGRSVGRARGRRGGDPYAARFMRCTRCCTRCRSPGP